MAVDKVRETALTVLMEINEKGAYSNIALNKHLEACNGNETDRGFITELVYGTVKWRLYLDWVINKFSSVKLKKMSPWILNILRMGIYQLLLMDRIPPSAACNESVSLAKRYGHAASSGFVNAILRNINRNSGNIGYPPETDTVEYLSVRYSHPQWLVKLWLDRYGRDFTASLLESNNQTPAFIIRTNTQKSSRADLMNSLREHGLEVSEGRYADEAVVIGNPSGITKLELFREGYFQIQDESSMLVAKVLDPQPGEFIMDVCSAPGGKATHIAELMKDKGTVLARDIHEHKIALINQAVRRLGLKSVKTELFDAALLDESHIGKADRVLVDAPCTGLGIIRRKPDIKWAKETGDKKEITALQKRILYMASQYVRPGGVLVYSTCTLEPEENKLMIEDFLENNPEFERNNIASLLPEALQEDSTSKGYLQLYPNKHGMDGFFISRMLKRS